MTNGKVSLRDVYGATSALEAKMDKRFDQMAAMIRSYGSRVRAIELWKENIMGKVGIIVAIVTIVFSMAWDYVKSKLIH